MIFVSSTLFVSGSREALRRKVTKQVSLECESLRCDKEGRTECTANQKKMLMPQLTNLKSEISISHTTRSREKRKSLDSLDSINHRRRNGKKNTTAQHTVKVND